MDVPRLSPQELNAFLRQGEPVTLIDARKQEAWAHSDRQLPGALRLEPEHVADALGAIPQRKAIVVYCSCPDEATSAQVAENLRQRNFSNVFALRGGFDGWVRAGLPTEPRSEHRLSGEPSWAPM
ncbi:MAG TPA: rhodanese-like domain-containing protein [Polyangia bacterium]|jgi:rhodanese-related sulfurtransferase|nr:rhodanese-like domain-containing protein [Polyangia bacterium]